MQKILSLKILIKEFIKIVSFSVALPVYLPDVRYFTFFIPCKFMMITDHLQYQKRSAVTHRYITENSKLTIPVEHNGLKQPLSSKKIAPVEKWNIKHLKRIRHQFHNLPYFYEYFYALNDIYNNYDQHLVTFLENLLGFFMQKLQISTRIVHASSFEQKTTLENFLLNFSKVYNQKTFYFKKTDVAAGWINVHELEKKNLNCQAFNVATQSKYGNINILEFLFTYGPEASFLIRELA